MGPRTLVGIALDVSGSMASTFKSQTSEDWSRLHSMIRAIDIVLSDNNVLFQENDICVTAFGLRVGSGYVDILTLVNELQKLDLEVGTGGFLVDRTIWAFVDKKLGVTDKFRDLGVIDNLQIESLHDMMKIFFAPNHISDRAKYVNLSLTEIISREINVRGYTSTVAYYIDEYVPDDIKLSSLVILQCFPDLVSGLVDHLHDSCFGDMYFTQYVDVKTRKISSYVTQSEIRPAEKSVKENVAKLTSWIKDCCPVLIILCFTEVLVDKFVEELKSLLSDTATKEIDRFFWEFKDNIRNIKDRFLVSLRFRQGPRVLHHFAADLVKFMAGLDFTGPGDYRSRARSLCIEEMTSAQVQERAMGALMSIQLDKNLKALWRNIEQIPNVVISTEVTNLFREYLSTCFRATAMAPFELVHNLSYLSFKKYSLESARDLFKWILERSNKEASSLHSLKSAGGSSMSQLESPNPETVSLQDFKNAWGQFEVCVFGETPMCSTITHLHECFQGTRYQRQALLLISDGGATDGDPNQIAETMKSSNVIIMSCVLTDHSSLSESRNKRLHFCEDISWTSHEKKMFQMSSEVPVCIPAVLSLQNRGWKVPNEGRCRLFVRCSSTEVLQEFCSLIRTIGTQSDALIDVVRRVDLGVYINTINSGFVPHEQKGGTCYAHAVSAVFHLAKSRIWGCQVPTYDNILMDLIDEFGENGAHTEGVLARKSHNYRLRYKTVDEAGARQAVMAGRCVVATFVLEEHQWSQFGKFFTSDEKGGVLDCIEEANSKGLVSGHAVVLVGCDVDHLRFMNSWGTKWGQDGFFRISSRLEHGLIKKFGFKFYDVFWYEKDLTEQEKTAFKERDCERLQRWGMGPQESFETTCPECGAVGPCRSYEGVFYRAKCTSCQKTFSPTCRELILWLYYKQTYEISD